MTNDKDGYMERERSMTASVKTEDDDVQPGLGALLAASPEPEDVDESVVGQHQSRMKINPARLALMNRINMDDSNVVEDSVVEEQEESPSMSERKPSLLERLGLPPRPDVPSPGLAPRAPLASPELFLSPAALSFDVPAGPSDPFCLCPIPYVPPTSISEQENRGKLDNGLSISAATEATNAADATDTTDVTSEAGRHTSQPRKNSLGGAAPYHMPGSGCRTVKRCHPDKCSGRDAYGRSRCELWHESPACDVGATLPAATQRSTRLCWSARPSKARQPRTHIDVPGVKCTNPACKDDHGPRTGRQSM